MTIENLDKLPAFTTRPKWAALLGISDKALAAAEARGLEVSKPNQRTVVISRDAILNYFTRSKKS
jgi:hypothetical protein